MNEKYKIIQELLYRLNLSMRIATIQGGEIQLELCPYEADLIRHVLREYLTTIDEI